VYLLEANSKARLCVKIGWAGMDWINLAQDWGPVEGSCEHGTEPSGFHKMLEVLE
jgi:hypothetical protein